MAGSQPRSDERRAAGAQPDVPTRNDRPSKPRDAVSEPNKRDLVSADTELARHDVSMPKPRQAVEDTMRAEDSAPPAEASPPAMPAPPTERYRLGHELGRGGMGRVVEAYDMQLGRMVALKEVLPPKSGTGAGAQRRFAREVQLTARLEHPSIVPLYDSGIGPEGRPFYVMRRVTGRPLDECMRKMTTLDERLTLIPRVLGAIDAVAHAHKRGVIHRDIKPQNILLGELGETVVIDWGLAKVIGEVDSIQPDSTPPEDVRDSLPRIEDVRTQIGSVFGTPGFMAPEQARGEELGTQGDVYALGAVLYQLLGGQPPHSGHSATEVIERTSKVEVKRLDEIAPGVPPDLVTIVGKALALDRGARYQNAGDLAEDLRRFLDGQLVAAHSYTRRQRIGRFARRHRAALSVLAVASAAVAVMSWIGVHRIIKERDDASEARESAVEQKQAAEEARDRLADRHDLLVVMQAQALLEQNPTEAAALLKQIGPKSGRLADARVIAQAAATRGIAWAIEGPPEHTMIAQLDPEGRWVLQVTIEGMVRVWDTVQRKMVSSHRYAKFTRAYWVTGGRVLVTPEASPPELLDPGSNVSDPLPLGPVKGFSATSDAGDRVVMKLAAGGLVLFDPTTKATTPIAYDRELDHVVMAPDGSWFAVLAKGKKAAKDKPADPGEAVVFDAKGTVLARWSGEGARLAASRAKRVAVLTYTGVVECRLDATPPVWIDVPLDASQQGRIIDFAYRGDELDMYVSGPMEVRGWRSKLPEVDPKDPKKIEPQPKTWLRGKTLSYSSPGMFEVADETIMWPTSDGRLHFVNELIEGSLMMPIATSAFKIAARPGSSRIVVLAQGALMGFDLEHVIPQRISDKRSHDGHFVDDDTLLLTRQAETDWQWVDLRNGHTVPTKYDPVGMLLGVSDVDPSDGRVLVRETSPRGMRILSLRKNAPDIAVLEDDKDAWATLIPGDAILYGPGDGRVKVRVGNEREREVVKLDGNVTNAVALGPQKFAAHSEAGEVVRGDIATARIERTRVAPVFRAAVGADGAGRPLLAHDKRLLVWDGAVTEIAVFDKRIHELHRGEGGVVATLGDGEARVVDMRNGATSHRVLVAGRHFPVVAPGGKLLANLDSTNRVQIVELPSRAHWALPLLSVPLEATLDVSASGTRILQAVPGALAVWHLPKLPATFTSWLDEQTNAIIDNDGVLAWPWQQTKSP